MEVWTLLLIGGVACCITCGALTTAAIFLSKRQPQKVKIQDADLTRKIG